MINSLKLHIILNEALGKKNISEGTLKEYEEKIKVNFLEWETNQTKYFVLYSSIAQGKEIKEAENL